jgi:hypothetical protein
LAGTGVQPLDRITVLADAQPVTHDLVEINENLIPQEFIHLILTSIVPRAQAANRADLIGGIVVDVHAGAALPRLNTQSTNPSNATLSSSRSWPTNR